MLVKELVEEIEIEFEYLETILHELETLLKKPFEYEPSLVEITGAGGLLHNFYNGIENIFKRILKFHKINQEESKNWHKELLKKFYDKENNFAFLDISIYDNLLEILKFRHLFIHGYGFFLQWELLKPLIKKALESYPKLKNLCESFLRNLENQSDKDNNCIGNSS
ncbi:MAG: hypothetical protein JSV88_05730 [Candidatus Aminicenantes bacterium]|nr:MAG: hypothetical protein JSV88_05730 [Candidatus Aminicenantes bacterium]